MIHITKGKFHVLVFTQVVSVLLSVVSTVMVAKVVVSNPDVCLNQQCARETEIVKQVDNQTIESPQKTTTQITPVTKVPSSSSVVTDPASVRAAILSEYDSYTNKMKVYVTTTYPTWLSVKAAMKSWDITETNNGSKQMDTTAEINYSQQIGYSALVGTITKDTGAKIESEIKNFCDLNHSITTEDERSYCHSVFIESVMQSKLMQ